jgi:2,4-dienoyl-CoA reductase-like NADH-dependent reductase (Old Yellow Enzyme family)
MMKPLLQKKVIENKNLKNPIVMAPLVTWLSDESGKVKEKHLIHYRERTGPGLIIVEAATVSPEGRLGAQQLGIFDDNHIPGLRKLVEIIKSSGALPGIQIHHAGGRSTMEKNYGLIPLVPTRSAVIEKKECRELSVEEIHRIQSDFLKGAERAVEAGFEYIEIHGAHGYLGTQFLSPITNRRQDLYGGSLENRQRFLLELYSLIKKTLGNKAIISCRLGVAEKDGLTMEEGIDTAEKLKALGMNTIHISSANSIPDLENLPHREFSTLINMGAIVKEKTGMTVIGVGGVKRPETAEAIIEENIVDLVAVGKAILCDPQWAVKAIEGKGEQIDTCLDCRRCLWFTKPEKCPVRIKRGNK